MSDSKICLRCQESKSLDSFSRRKTGWYERICKVCVNKRHADYNRSHPEKRKDVRKKSRTKNREKILEAYRKYNEKNIEQRRKYGRERGKKLRENPEYRKKLSQRRKLHRFKNKESINAKKREEYRNNIESHLLRGARARAKRSGLKFSITVGDVCLPERCPVFPTRALKAGDRSTRNSPCGNSPSIDRIEPALGYVPGNVEVISLRANWLKRDSTARERALILMHDLELIGTSVAVRAFVNLRKLLDEDLH